MESETFQEAWQRVYPQAEVSFEDDVFWRSLYPHARIFARIVRLIWSGYFQRDMELIRRLGTLNSANEVRFEIDNYRYQHPEYGLFRRGFRLRVSGKRLIQLARKVMRRDENPDYSLTPAR